MHGVPHVLHGTDSSPALFKESLVIIHSNSSCSGERVERVKLLMIFTSYYQLHQSLLLKLYTDFLKPTEYKVKFQPAWKISHQFLV